MVEILLIWSASNLIVWITWYVYSPSNSFSSDIKNSSDLLGINKQQVSVLSTLFQFHHIGHRGLFIMWESTGWVTGWCFADGHVRVTLLLELISQLKTCWSKQSQVFVSIFVSIGPIWPPTQTHLVRNDEIFLRGSISRGDSIQNILGNILGFRTGWELLNLFMNQMKSCQTPSPAFAREIQYFSQVSFYFSSTASWIKCL